MAKEAVVVEAVEAVEAEAIEAKAVEAKEVEAKAAAAKAAEKEAMEKEVRGARSATAPYAPETARLTEGVVKSHDPEACVGEGGGMEGKSVHAARRKQQQLDRKWHMP
jgi:hypothetical protein